MVAQGLFSIGGIASGLDTDDIVTQLMALERQPVNRLEQRQATLQTTRDAWGELTTRLSSLRSATDQLRRPDRFRDMTSLTSSSDAVSVSRGSGRVEHGEMSFTVDQLASRMQQSIGDRFEGLDAELGDRTLTILGPDGIEHDLTGGLPENATLRDLVEGINAANIGVTASALQVESGQFQLVLAAENTGQANSFEVVDAAAWDDADGFVTTQEAKDAILNVAGIQVTRSTNTIDDLIDGASITLRNTSQVPVTVSASRDVDGAVEAVSGFVEELNRSLAKINELTDYDPETREAGPLQGQFAANQLAFDLRSAVTRPPAGVTGPAALASTIGLSVDREGVVQLDEAKLRQAFTDDFEGTAARFARGGSSSDPDAAAEILGTRDTQAGTYDVNITKAATVARQVGAYYDPPGEHQPKNFMVRAPGGQVVSVQIDTSDPSVSTAQIRNRIEQALSAADVTGLRVGIDTDEQGREALSLESTNFGDAVTFEVWAVDEEGERDDTHDVFGLAGLHRGSDVEGTIGDAPATGAGRTLISDEGPSAGLRVYTSADLEVAEGETHSFDVNFWHGVGGAMDGQLARAEGRGGSISRARASLESQMRLYQDRIESFEQRLESREVTLRRQFVAMESALNQFNSQGEWLQGQLAQLSGMNAQNR